MGPKVEGSLEVLLEHASGGSGTKNSEVRSSQQYGQTGFAHLASGPRRDLVQQKTLALCVAG